MDILEILEKIISIICPIISVIISIIALNKSDEAIKEVNKIEIGGIENKQEASNNINSQITQNMK